MALFNIDQIFSKIASKFRIRSGSSSRSKTFNPNTSSLSAPQYREHLTNIFDQRQANDSRALLSELFKHDPDVSAAVGAYLTLADTDIQMVVRTAEGEIDPEATRTLHKLVRSVTEPTDYTQGFQMKPNLSRLATELRYTLMLRGALAGELVFNKLKVPDRIMQVDPIEIEWEEKEAGVYKPTQVTASSNERINLDIPNFFFTYHRRNPFEVYAYSDFVSAINTIAARQQVINDLYRIMKLTGYPRIDIKVMEEVMVKNMPASVKDDPVEYKAWLNARLTEITNTFNGIEADQPMTHWDSVEIGIMNEKAPGASMDISAVIETLNAQNQAGLKTMSTVIGRGTSGVNTASAEVRIAAMNADQLNKPVAEFLSRMFTFLLNVNGVLGFADISFRPAELRPSLELENHRTMLDSRLRQDLSLGLITDDEYHMRVHGRPRPASSPILSGTNFMDKDDVIDTSDTTSNTDPLGRSLTPEGAEQGKSNESKTPDS